MELYYKDLISEDSSLEELVDDLVLVVQGAEEFAQASGANLEPGLKEELTTRLQRLKEACRRVEKRAVAGAQATDKLLRRHPYSCAGAAFVLGVIAAVLLTRTCNEE
jgi:ElaB/YqjD/DUF883 family membrane-anchored ribosome-binding protein